MIVVTKEDLYLKWCNADKPNGYVAHGEPVSEEEVERIEKEVLGDING